RADRVVEKLRPQAAADELGDGLLPAVRRPPDPRLLEQAELGAEGEEWRPQKAAEAAGEGVQASALPQIALLGGGGSGQLLLREAAGGDQRGDVGVALQHRVRPHLEAPRTLGEGLHGAADARRGFEDGDLETLAGEQEGGGEAGDAGAEDQDVAL